MNGDIQETTSSPSSDSQKMNPVIIGIVVLVIALIGFYALKTMGTQNSVTTKDNAEVIEAGTTPTNVTMPGEAILTDDNQIMESENTDGVRVITVEAGSFYYTPNEIRVKKGETVRIVMNSVDMMHNFNIDELDVSIPITKSGETNMVEFTADSVGEFEYYCSVGEHRANGQVGTLIVEE